MIDWNASRRNQKANLLADPRRRPYDPGANPVHDLEEP